MVAQTSDAGSLPEVETTEPMRATEEEEKKKKENKTKSSLRKVFLGFKIVSRKPRYVKFKV